MKNSIGVMLLLFNTSFFFTLICKMDLPQLVIQYRNMENFIILIWCHFLAYRSQKALNLALLPSNEYTDFW